MKIKIIVAIVCFVSNLMFLSAQNIETTFVNMPSILFPTLNSNQRMEMLEYFKSNMNDTTKNLFGGESSVIKFEGNANYIKIQSTKSSTFEMLCFKDENDKAVVGIIKTVCSPICSSTIEFYDTTWNVLPIRKPDLSATNWILKDEVEKSDISYNEYAQLLNVSFISCSFNPQKQAVDFINNSLLFQDETNRKKLEPVMNNYAISVPFISFLK